MINQKCETQTCVGELGLAQARTRGRTADELREPRRTLFLGLLQSVVFAPSRGRANGARGQRQEPRSHTFILLLSACRVRLGTAPPPQPRQVAELCVAGGPNLTCCQGIELDGSLLFTAMEFSDLPSSVAHCHHASSPAEARELSWPFPHSPPPLPPGAPWASVGGLNPSVPPGRTSRCPPAWPRATSARSCTSAPCGSRRSGRAARERVSRAYGRARFRFPPASDRWVSSFAGKHGRFSSLRIRQLPILSPGLSVGVNQA